MAQPMNHRTGCTGREAVTEMPCQARETASQRTCQMREAASQRACQMREAVSQKSCQKKEAGPMPCPEKETRTPMPCPERETCPRECNIPTRSREQLLKFLDEESFAVYEALLFLDTHPDDADAHAFFREHHSRRIAALDAYARLYGPLTIDAMDDSASCSWEWMQQPWPWEGMEGGAC